MVNGLGSKHGPGFRIATQSFTREECELLCRVLKDNFDLDATIHLQQDKPKIYIRASSMERLRALVLPYFHDSMLYKLP